MNTGISHPFPTLFTSLFLLMNVASPVEAKTTYVLGVISPRHPHIIQNAYHPLKEYLEKELDCRVVLDPVVNYTEGLKRMTDRKWDLAFATNDTYLEARASGYRALAMVTENGKDHYKSIVVVKADGPIKSLADLKGKHMAFVSSKSASGYLYPMKVLLDQNLSPNRDMRISFTGNASIIGKGVGTPSPYGASFDAGAFYDGFLAENPEIARHLRVIAESRPIPHIPVVAGPIISADARRFASFQTAFLKASNRAPRIFEPDGVFFDGFKPPEENLYEQVLTIRTQVQDYEKRQPRLQGTTD